MKAAPGSLCSVCLRGNDETHRIVRALGAYEHEMEACHQGCRFVYWFGESGLTSKYDLQCGHYYLHHHGSHLCCRCR